MVVVGWPKYTLKNGKRCCSKSYNSCPVSKRKNSEKNKNRVLTQDHKQKISNSKKGTEPWNKGKRLPNLSIRTKDKISKSTTLEKNGNWKGGYSLENIPTYDFFYDKLTIEEKSKRDINDPNILTVIYTHCKKRFIPLLTAVRGRVRSLNGLNNGEQRLYCSEECKKECSIFGKQNYQEHYPKNNLVTYNEYQQFREYVLERDNYKC